MRLDIGSYTDKGLQRDHNEDALRVREPASTVELEQQGFLLAVADGMGGHLAGEVASQTAVETLFDEYLRTVAGDPGRALEEALAAANRVVWEAGQADVSRAGMGTTMVAAVVRPGRLTVAHVGDSPAFLLRGGVASRLTQDHSWVAEAVKSGHLDRREAERHPYRHVLTRALGSQPAVEVDVTPETPIAPGDTILLCSDGLVRHVAETELVDLVKNRACSDAARTLVELANRRGGEDNTTVVICRVLSS